MSRDAAASRYEIPGQLQQLLLDFTVSCLVERPADLVEFAADYFAQLRQRRTEQQQQTAVQQQQTGGGLVAGSAAHGNGHGPESDDSMLTDESDEPSPGKKPPNLYSTYLIYPFCADGNCFIFLNSVTTDGVHV
jgi:cAMP-dependent protein kinase regulator